VTKEKKYENTKGEEMIFLSLNKKEGGK